MPGGEKDQWQGSGFDIAEACGQGQNVAAGDYDELRVSSVSVLTQDTVVTAERVVARNASITDAARESRRYESWLPDFYVTNDTPDFDYIAADLAAGNERQWKLIRSRFRPGQLSPIQNLRSTVLRDGVGEHGEILHSP